MAAEGFWIDMEHSHWVWEAFRPNPLGGALRDFNSIIKNIDFLAFWRIWHMGAFGSMEKSPMVCADDLPSVLGISKHDPKSGSANIFFKRLDLAPNSSKHIV